MKFEVIEYTKDESGNQNELNRYRIEQVDLSRITESLTEDMRNGRISDFYVGKVLDGKE